jgi:WD40 repeat protein/transcriptional regulator with XRE-family HTH domain
MNTPDPTPVQTRSDFASALTAVRERAGKTVRDVSRSTGISVSTVGGYFSGRHLPPLKPTGQLAAILDACEVTDQATREAWDAALLRVRKAPGPRPVDAVAPYRGLAPFGVNDAAWFFGRDAIVAQVESRIEACLAGGGGLVFVIGVSGSGKSSVLRAGVIARARERALGAGAPVRSPTLITPGVHPVATLQTALATAPPVETAGDAVLVVDQFEELFTLCGAEAERREFIAALADAYRQNSAHLGSHLAVVIGLRSDFFTQAISFAALAEAMESSTVVVGQMTDQQLRATIEEPARLAGLDLEVGLVDVLLDDLGTASGTHVAVSKAEWEPETVRAAALPLLSHALLSTWERSRRGQLTVADYVATGGIQAAVAETAEAVFLELDGPQQRAARYLFRRLVLVSDDTVDTRRRVALDEITDEGQTREVIEGFVQRRMLVIDENSVEITHEALLPAWPRLQRWLDDDREGLIVHRRLTVAANDWARSGREPSMLYRGGRLSAARKWAEQLAALNPGEINALEHEFLTASTAVESREAAAVRTQTRRLRQLLAGLVVLVLIAATLSGFTLRLRSQATRQRDLALSRQVAAAANRTRPTDPGLSAQLAVTAYRLAPTAEAASSVLDSSTTLVPTRLIGPPGVMQALTATPDGGLLAGAGSVGMVRLWSRRGDTTTRIADIDVSQGKTIFALAFSPDGRTLAAAGVDRSVHLIDVSDRARPKPSATLTGARDTVYGLSFSPDGNLLVAGGNDGAVHRWDISAAPYRAMSDLTGDFGAVRAVAFAPGAAGDSVLAAGTETGARLWTGATQAHPEVGKLDTTAAPGRVYAVAFSHDGLKLAAGSSTGTVVGWDSKEPDWQSTSAWKSHLSGPTSWVNGVAFLPGDQMLAAAGSDNRGWIWDLTTGAAEPALIHPGPVAAITVLDDGKLVATADADGQARLWRQPSRLAAHDPGTPYQLTYSADGSVLLDGSTAGQVSQWNTRDTAAPERSGVPLTLPAGEELSGAATFTSDGRLVAAGTKTGGVHLWSLDAKGAATRLPTKLTAGKAIVEWVSFNPDGRILAAGGDDAAITLWDVSAPDSPTRIGPPLPADNYVFSMAFNPKGDRLAVGTAGGMVQVWDVAMPSRPVRVGTPLRAAPSYVFSVAFSPDGSLLAAATASKDTALWRVHADDTTPTQLARIGGPTNNANVVAFSPDGQQLAVGSEDGSVWLYSISPEGRATATATLQAAGGRVISLAYSPDGRTLSAGAPHVIKMWTTGAGRVAAAICAGRGDPMTPAEWSLYLPGTPYRDTCA